MTRKIAGKYSWFLVYSGIWIWCMENLGLIKLNYLALQNWYGVKHRSEDTKYRMYPSILSVLISRIVQNVFNVHNIILSSAEYQSLSVLRNWIYITGIVHIFHHHTVLWVIPGTQNQNKLLLANSIVSVTSRVTSVRVHNLCIIQKL